MSYKKHNKKVFGVLSAVFLLSTLSAGNAFAASSSVTITTTEFLSFASIPDSHKFSTTVSGADQELTSDSDGQLGTDRYLEVQDTRDCGGFQLTLGADTFTPASTPELRDNLRILTNEDDAATGTDINGVTYLTGFSGDQTVSAPLDVTTTSYSDPTTFTGSPFDVTDNILDAPITILDGGPLTAPTGRDGTMHVGMSFYLEIPKYFLPNVNPYYSTLTYTLSDDTTGTC